MKRWLPLALILAAVAVGAACFTVDTVTRPTGPGPEALLNPWLAAERVLERRGLAVDSEPDFGGAPARAQVVVLATALDFLGEDEQEALLTWVRDGGHLVTAPARELPRQGDKDTSLLGARLDVRLREVEETPGDTRVRAAKSTLQRLVVEPGGSLEAQLQRHYRLEAGPGRVLWQARDAYGLYGLRRPFGRGRITVLSDLAWLQNSRLGSGDHAGLLWSALEAPPRAHVLLVPGVERPSLLSLAWERAAPLLAALALFILVWLWQVTRRFGPLRPGLPGERRRLAEHLEATGHYLLRHGGLPRLYEASRARLLAQVQRRHPQWRALPAAQLARELAGRARIEVAAVERVLTTAAPDHLPQFAADIRLLNRLRKAL